FSGEMRMSGLAWALTSSCNSGVCGSLVRRSTLRATGPLWLGVGAQRNVTSPCWAGGIGAGGSCTSAQEQLFFSTSSCSPSSPSLVRVKVYERGTASTSPASRRLSSTTTTGPLVASVAGERAAGGEVVSRQPAD